MLFYRLLLIALIMPMLNWPLNSAGAYANELFGKSIKAKYKIKVRQCSNNGCKSVVIPMNAAFYVSNDGKTVFSYRGKQIGNVYKKGASVRIGDDLATTRVRSNSLTNSSKNRVTGNVGWSTYTAHGSKCSISEGLKGPRATYTISFVGPKRCSVHTGNIFK